MGDFTWYALGLPLPTINLSMVTHLITWKTPLNPSPLGDLLLSFLCSNPFERRLSWSMNDWGRLSSYAECGPLRLFQRLVCPIKSEDTVADIYTWSITLLACRSYDAWSMKDMINLDGLCLINEGCSRSMWCNQDSSTCLTSSFDKPDLRGRSSKHENSDLSNSWFHAKGPCYQAEMMKLKPWCLDALTTHERWHVLLCLFLVLESVAYRLTPLCGSSTSSGRLRRRLGWSLTQKLDRFKPSWSKHCDKMIAFLECAR